MGDSLLIGMRVVSKYLRVLDITQEDYTTIITYSFPTDQLSLLMVEIVGVTLATQRLILRVGVGGMIHCSWAIDIIHGLGMPCGTHWLLIQLE